MKIIKETTGKYGFPYIAYIPETVSDHPALCIQLHGAGERGNGGEETDKVLVHGFSKIVNDENTTDCILVMPQFPTDSFWVARIESLKRFIDAMIELYDPDMSRLYLCGLSMGGYGTWYFATAYPEMFAAIAPCCGGGMRWLAPVLKMPIWTFHGMKDTAVDPYSTIEMVERLKPLNPNLKYTYFENVGHNSWDYGFVEETWNWLLAQRKEN